MALEIFLNHFYKEYNELTNELNLLNKSDTEALTSNYDKISNRIQLLQNFFTEHSAYISTYEQRKAQDHLTKLNTQSAQVRNDLFPKKKFTFKSKKNLTSASKVVEETLSTAAEIQKKQQELDKNLEDLATKHTCTIKDCNNETIIKQEKELLNADVGITNVKNCLIKLYGQPSVIHLNNIENTIILCGPLNGTAFVNNCKNSKLNLACHQLRIHETFDTDFYIKVASRTIIENCKNVGFAPYSWTYENIKEHFKGSNFNNEDNNNEDNSWKLIDDFNWLVLNQKSPNWDFIDENKREKWND